MISSYDAGFNVRDATKIGTLNMLTVTTLSGENITWQDMIHAFHTTFPGYLALVVFDESEASKQLRQAVAERYLDLDRITGDTLLVLSTVPPPKDWFRLKREQMTRLPEFAQLFHRKEVELIGTQEGENAARYNSQKLIAEFFTHSPQLPCICFLWEHPSPDEPNTTFIDALAFKIAGFKTSNDVYDLFETLSRLAQDGIQRSLEPAELAKNAFSAWNPLSLRWKNATLQTMSMLDFLRRWREIAGF